MDVPETARGAAPRAGAARRFFSWYGRHVWAATAVLLVLAVLAGVVAVQVVLLGKVGDGVSVAGVSLQGLTKEQAERAVAGAVAARVAPVTLQTDGSEPVRTDLAALGISVDPSATAEAALRAGRRRLPFGLELWLPGGARPVAPVIRVDPGAFAQGLQPVRDRLDVAAKDARLVLRAGQVAVAPARDGRQVDAVALERAILASVAAGRAFSGPVPTTALAPEVSTADAQSQASAAAVYLARPITLRYRSRSVVLSPEQLAAMLSVNTGADAQDFPLTFRNGRARSALHRLFAFAERPAVDAKVEVADNGTISVTDGSSGEVLDMPTLLSDLDQAASSAGGLRTIFVALTPSFPKLTKEDVENMGLASLGSQFVTYFDPSNAARSTNIARAAKLVDGTVVAPGETFSLNAAMGPRTTNRGFDFAPVIAADNVLRQGVGGGVCQYATTLFNAVFFAGLPVVQREAHSLYISHYPIGRDATVSWGGADFKFRNDTAKSLMIRSWVSGGSLTVALVGQTGRKVTYTTSGFYDVRKPAHGKSDPRVIYDSDLGPGVVQWERGVDGRSVKVVRTVRDSSGKLLFRDTFASVYQPLDWIKRVGT